MICAVGHLTVDDITDQAGQAGQAGLADSAAPGEPAARAGPVWTRDLGGGALYAAVGAAVAGARGGVISRLGAGYPPDARAALEAAGLELDLEEVAEPPISHRVFYAADGTRTYRHHPDSGSRSALSPRPTRHRLPPTADAVHVAPMPVRWQREWVAAARAAGRPVTLDPHYEACAVDAPAVLSLVAGVRAFMPSELEARRLLSVTDPPAAALEFRALGTEIAVVKCGAAGSVIAFDDAVWSLPAVRAAVRDVTGAGDAYCGAFAAELARGGDPLEAARVGAVAASFTVESVGALTPLATSPREFTRRLGRVRPVRVRAEREES